MLESSKSVVEHVQQTLTVAEHEVNKVDIPLTRKLGLVDFGKELIDDMSDDHVGAFAGNLAYQGLFSIFPFLVFLVSLLGVFHATGLVNNLIQQASSAMPRDAVSVLTRISHSVTASKATGAFTVGAIVSILASLWSLSGGFRAVMEATNVMYDVKDSRPFWRQYLTSIVLSIAVVLLLIAALVLVVAGPSIGGSVASHLGMGNAFRSAWNILQWPLLLCFVLLAFALVYYWAPDVEQRFRFLSPGTLAAVGLWLTFSLLFSLYVNNFGSYNKTYGTLAGIAIFLLYMYYSAFILLLGAEINHIVERHAANSTRGKGETSSRCAVPNGKRDTLTILRENRPAPVEGGVQDQAGSSVASEERLPSSFDPGA